MSTSKSLIEWTERTWNPVRGCSLISPGCTNCYAMGQAHRFAGPGKPYEGLTRARRGGPVWTGEVREVFASLAEPLTWRAPSTVFVNSMSDLFHEDVTDQFIAAVFGVMSYARRHTFQVLTKRARRMRDWHEWLASEGPAARDRWIAAVTAAERMCGESVGSRGAANADGRDRVVAEHASSLVIERRNACITAFYRGWPPPNVHLGVSVEDREHGLPRIELLRETPAALRFLSVEPLLEDLGALDLRGIGWVIVGGESGHNARRCDLAWIRRVVDQCREQRVPVFVKQLGARPSGEWPSSPVPQQHHHPARRGEWVLNDSKGGDPSEWPESLRVREMPEVSR